MGAVPSYPSPSTVGSKLWKSPLPSFSFILVSSAPGTKCLRNVGVELIVSTLPQALTIERQVTVPSSHSGGGGMVDTKRLACISTNSRGHSQRKPVQFEPRLDEAVWCCLLWWLGRKAWMLTQ